MTEPRLTEFDFETLSVLAKTDPGSFETLRQKAIERAIARAPAGSRQRLRRLQWRIDRVRETSRTPLAACVLISNMMWTSFNDLNRVYQRLGENTESGASRARRERPLAADVPFRPRPH
ncbi:MAG: DUF3135 domain-containing protein [Gammaproteobacteria bacterium]